MRAAGVAFALALFSAACSYPDFVFDEGGAPSDGGGDSSAGDARVDVGGDAIPDAHDVGVDTIVPPSEAGTCPTGLSLCAGGCVDLKNDGGHCGTCTTVCTGSRVCSAGSCACPGGWLECSGVCVDPSTDAAHCGSCTTSCPSGQSCSAGKCGCGAGLTSCGGSCVDTSTDNAHCGSCDTVCAGGERCTGGACACPFAATDCSHVCLTLASDPLSCGSCGHACTSDKYCSGGSCVCRPGWIDCGTGSCIDVDNDPYNCGGCGAYCPYACVHGSCTTSGCPGGTLSCGPNPPDGNYGCPSTSGDALNCGVCGTPCAPDQVCTGGACHKYFPGLGCTSCPCAWCPSGYTCCPGLYGVPAMCVAGISCS